MKPSASLTPLFINDQTLEYVNCFMYLGITLDRKLNFVQHFNETISKLNSKVYLLCKIRPFINTNTATIIYKSYLLSYPEYGSNFFSGLCICHRADRHTSNLSLHCESKVLALEYGRRIIICSFMSKLVRRNPDTLMITIREGNRSASKRLANISFPRSDSFKMSHLY